MVRRRSHCSNLAIPNRRFQVMLMNSCQRVQIFKMRKAENFWRALFLKVISEHILHKTTWWLQPRIWPNLCATMKLIAVSCHRVEIVINEAKALSQQAHTRLEVQLKGTFVYAKTEQSTNRCILTTKYAGTRWEWSKEAGLEPEKVSTLIRLAKMVIRSHHEGWRKNKKSARTLDINQEKEVQD